MQMPQADLTGKSIYAKSCCKDHIADFVVDNNYNLSTLHLDAPTLHLLQVFYIPENIGCPTISTSFSPNSNVQPPGKFIASAVNLPDICVFLI